MAHPRPRRLSTRVSPSDSLPGFDAQFIVSPLELKVYSPSEMAAELEKIHDEESRRLTRLAFMCG
ncbi:hypothetical protein CPB85DRAFT_1302564 [Mucidula mucida]|nr:hypothetical protein CPB85DRAFT_1302564 [Mucidula mucida]